MAVTGIGISDDHLLKILGFRLIPVAAGGHLGSKIANTPPYLKVGMSSGPEIHGFSPVKKKKLHVGTRHCMMRDAAVG